MTSDDSLCADWEETESCLADEGGALSGKLVARGEEGL